MRDLHKRLRSTSRLRGPVIILPYDGFGTPDFLALCGRVLEDEGFRPARDADRAWRNLVAMYKRFESDEVPGARVRARYGKVEVEAIADREGYFSIELRPDQPVAPGWHDVALELASAPHAATATGRVLVPPGNARIGVISDIDDTVVRTDVTRKLRMLLALAISNARTRKPFEGVAAFYRALRDGPSGKEGNPLFYVSNSPWNLYVPLVEFLAHQEIPPGPLLLRDFGRDTIFSAARHKERSITRILERYPKLQFVLIGDSGEEDPEIYSEVVRRSPDRIRIIYIRSVHRHPARLAAIDRLIDEVKRTACQLVVVPDSEFAAVHAAGEGLISPATLAGVRRDKNSDEGKLPQQLRRTGR